MGGILAAMSKLSIVHHTPSPSTQALLAATGEEAAVAITLAVMTG